MAQRSPGGTGGGTPVTGTVVTATTEFDVGSSSNVLTGPGAGIFNFAQSGNGSAEIRTAAGFGGYIAIRSVQEVLTIAAAATTVSATSLPANIILLAVAVRVTTVIPTAATFTVTKTVGGTALNTAAVSTAATSTDPGTAAGALYLSAASTITITPNLTPGAATGVVRIEYFYLAVQPPTS